MIKETNIVEQKIEEIAEKWIDATQIKSGRIIRILADNDEEELVDTFFQYLLSIDSTPDDIAIFYESIFEDEELYSSQLLEELESILYDWNNSDKNDNVPFEPIKWKPDYTLKDKKNNASLFVENINSFAKSLNLQTDVKVTAILKFYSGEHRLINQWLEQALESQISPQIRFAISDTVFYPYFNEISSKNPKEVITIKPEANMKNILAQLAANGDPSDPATPYRHSFVCLMKAIEEKNKKDTKKYGERCIEIAKENIGNNPYWLSQLIGVFITLSNAYWSFKDKKKAFEYADSAVASSILGKDEIDSGIYYRQQGQAYLYRGSLFCAEKEWKQSIQDFQISSEAYASCNDYVLQVESLRMEGYAAKKSWSEDAAVPLAKGARLGKLIPVDLINASSYSLLIKQLLATNYKSEIKEEELDEILIPIWGNEWREFIHENMKDVFVE